MITALLERDTNIHSILLSEAVTLELLKRSFEESVGFNESALHTLPTSDDPFNRYDYYF